MYKKDFYYELPPELIAQTPLENRDSSRMLHLDRESGRIRHSHFRELPEFLRPGDCLVLNDTKVIPARLYGKRQDSGTVVEFLLLSQKSGDVWEALAGPGKRARPGHKFTFTPELQGEILEILEGGNRLIKFQYTGIFTEILDRAGEMPLPHYITEKLRDKNRYQTIYAAHDGSAAAPTAGLHFTSDLLNLLSESGIKLCKITLHVGLGTFRPVKEESIHNHKMHSESYHIPAETARIIGETKSAGGRVICVGTTSCRALESAAARGEIAEYSGDTDIFITPGYTFRVMDGLITNFHLPESTLIMLVSAFAGHKNVMNAYNTAVQEEYRFFSFGDAMVIL